MTVKRKCKTHNQGRMHWWFVLKAEEETLAVLEKEYIFDTLCNALEVIDVSQFSNFHSSLVHSICTSSAPALEMHSAQVLEMLAQMECPRSVQVLQEMLCIQECVQECVIHNSYVITVSKKCSSWALSKLGPNLTHARDTSCGCGFDYFKDGVLSLFGEVLLHDFLLYVGI